MAFESLLAYSYSLFQGGSAGHAYNEQAFRHFLALERKRAEHSTRSFLLVLVSLKNCPEMSVRISPALATVLFSRLALCVREVDFIGWYREGRVAGAVLAQAADPPEEVSRRVGERVTKILCSRLSSHLAQRLQVRVIALRRKARG